jgi:hypothetical protein
MGLRNKSLADNFYHPLLQHYNTPLSDVKSIEEKEILEGSGMKGVRE